MKKKRPGIAGEAHRHRRPAEEARPPTPAKPKPQRASASARPRPAPQPKAASPANEQAVIPGRSASNRLIAQVVLSTIGLAVSIYLTATRVAPDSAPLVCSVGGCEQVAASSESSIGPVPVAALGVVWFVAMLALAVASVRSNGPLLTMARLIWGVAGLLSVLYLIYAEVFVIRAICQWCTAVHVIVIALVTLAAMDYRMWRTTVARLQAPATTT